MRIHKQEQLAPLRRVLQGLKDARVDEIWLVAQQPSDLALRLAADETNPVAGIELAEIVVQRQLYCRPRLINSVLPRLKSDLVWLVDPALDAPYRAIVDRLRQSNEVFVQPFSRVDKVDKNGNIVRGEAPCALGRCGFAVERAVLLVAGGLHEGFMGASEEGFELVRRLKPFFRDFVQYDFCGTLAHVPKRPDDGMAARDAQSLLARLAKAIDGDIDAYLRERLESALPVDRAELGKLSRARARAKAFAFTNPTPPRVEPAQLPGTIWGITSFFNPSRYRSKRDNVTVFREGLRRQGLPLCLVELAMGDDPFQLSGDDADLVVQIRGGDWLWQKERLLNVALARLPAACDKVVWLDADILFERDDWVSSTASMLEQHVIVQPFSSSVRLEQGERACPSDDLPIGSSEHELLHGMAYGVAAKGLASLDRYLEHGHCGYAWAARRSLLAKHGFYDANVLGNGDLNMAHAMFMGRRALKTERLSDACKAHLSSWADRFYADVRGSVGYVEGRLLHLWHGRKDDRRYVDRLEILIEQEFDPELHLATESTGAFRWSDAAPAALRKCCEAYFRLRREDG